MSTKPISHRSVTGAIVVARTNPAINFSKLLTWKLALLRCMAYGGWRSEDELVPLGATAVPAERGFRFLADEHLRKTGRELERTNTNVFKGQRYKATQTLGDCVRSGLCDMKIVEDAAGNKVKWYRMVASVRRQFIKAGV